MTLRRLGELHVFLRRDAARTRVSALSGVRLPDCFARIRAADLRDAERRSARVRADEDACTVVVDVEVLVETDVRAALQAAERVGPRRRPCATSGRRKDWPVTSPTSTRWASPTE
jgi:hypothetical protein